MPKKAPGERYRYIAFRICDGGPFARNDFLDSLFKKARGSAIDGRFRITVYEPSVAILKVPHVLKDAAIEVLTSVDEVRGRSCRVETLLTSGTIKTLKERYLGEGERKRKRRE